MSTQYATEPPPTATVLLHTTAGPLTLSLFAQQTPLTCRNFLQHVLDGYYDGCIFHRVAPGFVVQTGDPTGTGEGGVNIYEDGDKSLERFDEDWGRLLKLPEERMGERIRFGDEIHSRLKFNRRGLVGMARMSTAQTGQYGSQFFITLADCRAELDGKCTMFGRIEGDGIYNVVKIAEGELVEGGERPLYPEKILRAEVVEMPTGAAWEKIRKRALVAQRTAEEPAQPKKKILKKKGGKALLSFGGDEGEEDGVGLAAKPKKAKFNTALIDSGSQKSELNGTEGKINEPHIQPKSKLRSPSPSVPQKRKVSEPERVSESSPISQKSETRKRKLSFHEPTTQLPIRDPESPSRSPTQSPPPPIRRQSSHKSASALEAEIAALKASMRRDTAPAAESKKPLSALEALIPATSTRGRKRPRPGDNNAKEEGKALKLLNAFKSRLESAEAGNKSKNDKTNGRDDSKEAKVSEPDAPDEEAALCDLHFIANCQSCSNWTDDATAIEVENDKDGTFLSHSLTFEKDRLGKDLNWKRKNEEELVVIDPREREKELGIKSHRDKGKDRDVGGRRERNDNSGRKTARERAR